MQQNETLAQHQTKSQENMEKVGPPTEVNCRSVYILLLHEGSVWKGACILIRFLNPKGNLVEIWCRQISSLHQLVIERLLQTALKCQILSLIQRIAETTSVFYSERENQPNICLPGRQKVVVPSCVHHIFPVHFFIYLA